MAIPQIGVNYLIHNALAVNLHNSAHHCFGGQYPYNKKSNDYKQYTNTWDYISDQSVVATREAVPTYTNKKTDWRYNSLNIYGTYEKSTLNEKHNFKVMAGFAQERDYTEYTQVQREDIIDPDLPSISGGTGTLYAEDYFSDYAIRSGYFRFNYNYENKYLLEATGCLTIMS